MISILQLDQIDYSVGLQLQERLIALRKESRIGDVLLLLEHKPVITLGRSARADNVIASPETLAQRDVEIFRTDRGGDVTFHGPGQLVGYPIFDLRGFPSPNPRRSSLGAVDFVRRLEEVLIRACADFSIPAKRVPGLTGVWTEQTEAKIAAIGIHISRSVTSHGFALNVTTDLDYFNLIVPCGIATKPVTSMARELRRPPAMQEVMHSIARNCGTVFQRQIVWLPSVEALMKESIGVPMKVPKDLRDLHKEEDLFLA